MVERIVGHDFLPRGRGIVTRMPLVLHLKLCPEDDRRRESFGLFMRNILFAILVSFLEGEPEDDFAVFDQEDKNKYYEDFNEVSAHSAYKRDQMPYACYNHLLNLR